MSKFSQTIMAVHAHPDDECIAGGASLIKYQAEGIQTVLVTCTNGEEGEIHDPNLDPEEAKPRLGEIRLEELRRSVAIMNIGALELLGYRDSGMVGSPANEHPECFHKADRQEAIGKLVKLVRKYRPQVMITYNSFGGYGHPDHIMAHKITVAAFDYATDTRRYPEAEFGEAWQPSKLYTTAFTRSSWLQLWEILKKDGREWPFQREGAPKIDENNPPEFGSPDNEITTIIDVGDYWLTARKAMAEHRTQIDYNSPWMKMRDEFGTLLGSTDAFILFKSTIPAQRPEYDLFAGLR
ncbi:MAG: PIG-L family deacetylase [Chloroflexi bacterium]|uniref:PIG-L family deacetylase n=1 Tax=Candidatus Chlorohelix allophototropha TaxID=3003348 RepID=A0A8T7LUS0_9CHLR|nr:PIG-L family deacetylase [Chloroflexota bacterium]WJW66522.1 PIG-L family deacetylase [Chloroflexota bacterium L227-S17]